MEYAILVYESPADFAERENPETSAAYHGAYHAYSEALVKAGLMSGGAGLRPPTTATTIRLREGRRLVQDGPLTETKEQLGGFFIINAADLDEAIQWAARCPAAARAGVEVRPVLPSPANE